MDFDSSEFYRERDIIMKQEDEDLYEYRKRMAENKSHFSQAGFDASFVAFSQGSLAPAVVNTGKDDDIHPMILEQGGSREDLCDSPNPTRELGGPQVSKELSLSCSQPKPLPGNDRTSKPLEHHGAVHGYPVVRTSHELNPIVHLNRVSASRGSEGRNVEEMCELAARTRNNNKRKSPIETASPAKRHKDGEAGPIWQDFSVQQTSTPLPLPRIEALPLPVKNPQTTQAIDQAEIECPSEITSFRSSPGRSPQELPSSGRSSPISSFSHVLTRSPNPALRQQQPKAKKPPLVLRAPHGQLFGGAAILNSKPGDAGVRRSKYNEDDPLTSPIEDPSGRDILPPTPAESLKGIITASGSTKLTLEVKERVAHHVALKRRDKVIPIDSNLGMEHAVLPGEQKDRDERGHPNLQISPSASSHISTPSRVSEVEKLLKQKSTRPSQAPSRTQKSKNAKKEKQRPVGPIEYAQQLLEKAGASAKRKASAVRFLEGKNIFYIGGDMRFAGERTRGRMEIIVRHGGNLIPVYDPTTVTHIVTDAPKPTTLRALGYKRLSEIPDHIPTVNWSWILSGIGRLGRLDEEDIKTKMEDVWLHSAFSERIDTVMNRSKQVIQPSRGDKTTGTPEAPNSIAGLSSLIQARSTAVAGCNPSSEFSTGRTTPSDSTALLSSPRPFYGKTKDLESGPLEAQPVIQKGADPLEEFYAEARAARDSNWSRFGECEDSDDSIDVIPPAPLPRQKRGWACDNREPRKQVCENQDIIEKLQELQELHKAKPGDEDHWRAFSYNKSIRALRGYPKRIQSYSEARSIRGVGDKTALKIMEILQTGDLRRINYEKTDDVQVTRLFQGIYGVGQSTAFKWYSAGCRTLEDLRHNKGSVRLNPAQLIGLQYYDDINDRMPRTEVKAIFDLIGPVALSFDPKLFVEIMGSYRREKADCGDIDILITRPTDDDQTHSGILGLLLPALHKTGIITEDLAIPEDVADLECVYRGLCRLPQPGSRRRRIDFLTVPWESRGAALLYYTGDDIFNRAMRLKANKMGYSLNQRGLYSGVVRDPKDSRLKLNEGTIVASETEEEIFRILDVPWQEPHERVRG